MPSTRLHHIKVALDMFIIIIYQVHVNCTLIVWHYLTSNWACKGQISESESTVVRTLISFGSFWIEISVSPILMSSTRASWIKIYWA